MTSSRKKNNTKQNSRVNSSSPKNNLLKSNSKNKTFSYSWKKIEKFELTKRRLIPLIIDKQKKFIIEWNQGEKEVYIAGCFYKNNKLYVSTNEKIYKYFRLNSNLINSLNETKFKAKGKMRISSIYIINNTNKTTKNKKDSQNIFSNNNISTKESSLISMPKKNDKKIDFAFSNKNYCNYIPKKDEMKYTADKKPCHFPIECFHGINQIHNEIGNKEYLTLTDSSVFNSNNDSYKNIDRKEHFLLNHLCQKNVNNKLINSFTVKYRHKNATFVYYK